MLLISQTQRYSWNSLWKLQSYLITTIKKSRYLKVYEIEQYHRWGIMRIRITVVFVKYTERNIINFVIYKPKSRTRIDLILKCQWGFMVGLHLNWLTHLYWYISFHDILIILIISYFILQSLIFKLYFQCFQPYSYYNNYENSNNQYPNCYCFKYWITIVCYILCNFFFFFFLWISIIIHFLI